MANFGSPSGPIFPFGKITVVAPGTPIGLSTTPTLGAQSLAGTGTVPSTTGFGTPAAGLPGSTLAGLPSQVVCMGLLLTCPASNNGLTYLCFIGTSGQPGSKNVPNSIVLGLGPGQFFPLMVPNLTNILMPGMFCVDADTGGNSMYVTALIA
jgi:hypothetical protein